MSFLTFWRKKVKKEVKADEIDQEEEVLKRIKRVNDLRDEVYQAIEGNIRKRLEKANKNSKKGKAYIDKELPLLGGKSNIDR